MARTRKPQTPFYRFNSSPDVIRLVVMMYVKYPLSLRNVEDLLHERRPSWSACATCAPSSGSVRDGRQGPGCSLSTLGTRLEYAASCGRCREERFPKHILLLTTQDR